MKIIEYQIGKTVEDFFLSIKSRIQKSTWLDNLAEDIDFSEFKIIEDKRIEIHRFPRFLSPFRAFGTIVIKLENRAANNLICEIKIPKIAFLTIFLLFSFPFIAIGLIVYFIFNITPNPIYFIPCLFIGVLIYLKYLLDRYMLSCYCDRVISSLKKTPTK